MCAQQCDTLGCVGQAPPEIFGWATRLFLRQFLDQYNASRRPHDSKFQHGTCGLGGLCGCPPSSGANWQCQASHDVPFYLILRHMAPHTSLTTRQSRRVRARVEMEQARAMWYCPTRRRSTCEKDCERAQIYRVSGLSVIELESENGSKETLHQKRVRQRRV